MASGFGIGGLYSAKLIWAVVKIMVGTISLTTTHMEAEKPVGYGVLPC